MAIILVAYLFACAVTAQLAANRKGNFWRMFVISIFVSPIGVLVNETNGLFREKQKSNHNHVDKQISSN